MESAKKFFGKSSAAGANGTSSKAGGGTDPKKKSVSSSGGGSVGQTTGQASVKSAGKKSSAGDVTSPTTTQAVKGKKQSEQSYDQSQASSNQSVDIKSGSAEGGQAAATLSVPTITVDEPTLAKSASAPLINTASGLNSTDMDDDLDLHVVIDPKKKNILQAPEPVTTLVNGHGAKSAPGSRSGSMEKVNQNGRSSPKEMEVVEVVKTVKGQESTTSMDSSLESPAMDEVLRDEANFIQNVSQFYNQEALSDVVLKVGDDRYYSHRFVLAKSSEYFRTMLYEHGWNQTLQKEVELEETPECQAVFDKFLKYLYTAEISISTMSAVGILCLADKYFVASLKELCCSYMIENSKSPKTRNALTWYSWAKALHLEPLLRQCTKTIAWNFHEIITSSDWVNMDVEFVADLYSNAELVVPNENGLWNALAQWLLHDIRKNKLVENARRLLPLIRFPQMLIGQLYTIEQHELTQDEEVKAILHKLLSQAYRYRALCPSQAQLGVSFQEQFYLPRDYTDLTVDNVRIQNTLRFGIQVDVKMYRGPVPSDARDGDWKLTYRKQQNVWALQIYCHETAMINGEARVQPCIIVYNDQEKVIQVHREPQLVCMRGATTTINTTVDQPELARNMAVLIKPVPS